MASAPVAQLDRVPDYESGGRAFESLRVHHLHLPRKFPKDSMKQSLVAFEARFRVSTLAALQIAI